MAKNNAGRKHRAKVSEHARYLTKSEMCTARLRLAAEMVELVHDDRAAQLDMLCDTIQLLVVRPSDRA